MVRRLRGPKGRYVLPLSGIGYWFLVSLVQRYVQVEAAQRHKVQNMRTTQPTHNVKGRRSHSHCGNLARCSLFLDTGQLLFHNFDGICTHRVCG